MLQHMTEWLSVAETDENNIMAEDESDGKLLSRATYFRGRVRPTSQSNNICLIPGNRACARQVCKVSGNYHLIATK